MRKPRCRRKKVEFKKTEEPPKVHVLVDDLHLQVDEALLDVKASLRSVKESYYHTVRAGRGRLLDRFESTRNSHIIAINATVIGCIIDGEMRFANKKSSNVIYLQAGEAESTLISLLDIALSLNIMMPPAKTDDLDQDAVIAKIKEHSNPEKDPMSRDSDFDIDFWIRIFRLGAAKRGLRQEDLVYSRKTSITLTTAPSLAHLYGGKR